MTADLDFFFYDDYDDLPKGIVNVTGNEKLFFILKSYFQSCNSLFKSSKNLLRFRQNPKIPFKMGTKTELVNTRNNTATIKKKE